MAVLLVLEPPVPVLYVVIVYGGFRFGPDMSTSELLPFKMTSEKTIEEPGV